MPHPDKVWEPIEFHVDWGAGDRKIVTVELHKDCGRGHRGTRRTKVTFLAIDTDIDSNTTQLGLVGKIELGIQKALGKTEKAREFLRHTWDFLKRIETSAVKIRPGGETKSDELLLEQFAYSLADVADRVCTETEASTFGARFDGVLILIDEADNASPELSLGSFFKLTTERLQRRGCNHVAFGIAGLPELRSVLAASHPSSLRLFEELVLGRLSTAEARKVIAMGLARANHLNVEQTSITEEARHHLAYYSEGYPHFIQQFAASAFTADTDNIIDPDDVLKGAFGRRGALELIGDRYYRDSYYTKIQKESYRQVLRIMADKLDDWVTRGDQE